MIARKITALPGRDYTTRPDGAWVFSREYLIARGTCCRSKCTNCPYEFSRETHAPQDMRPVVSMVPSWTETLIAAGADVVGRTRFCIHPNDGVRGIAVLGGTKTLASDATEKMQSLVDQAISRKRRLLVILDKEENPIEFQSFFEAFDCEIVATHVQNLATLARDLTTLASKFTSKFTSGFTSGPAESLQAYAQRAEALMASSPTQGPPPAFTVMKTNVSDVALSHALFETSAPVFYFIWKSPWMVVRADTWIGETLGVFFSKAKFPLDARRICAGRGESRYPQVTENEIPAGSILIFSSEPFPFAQSWSELLTIPFVQQARAVALVDGELFSWFGLRSIRFLEETTV